MADFVGLLKKTIETQSQVTPRLRQRIYERARATVERKLAESQAAEPIVERQRAILNQAIDEVEAYYQERDRQEGAIDRADVAALSQRQEAQSHVQPQGLAVVEDVKVGMHIPQAEPVIISPPFSDDSGQEESHDGSQQQPVPLAESTSFAPLPLAPLLPEADEQASLPILPDVVAQTGDIKAGDARIDAAPADMESETVPVSGAAFHDPNLRDESLEGLVSPSEAKSESVVEVKPDIPSLASLLNSEKNTDLQEPPPLPPDLPFLQDEAAPEGQELIASPERESGKNETVKPLPSLSSSWTSPVAISRPPSTGNMSPFEPPAASTQTETLADELLTLSPSVSIDAASMRPPVLEDYLPHWPEHSGHGENEASTRQSPVHEIDQVRRDIEALRDHESAMRDDGSALDELPFSTLNDAPWQGINQPAADQEPQDEQFVVEHRDSGFDNDPMSEIFVQAARREQKQSGRKRRVAAVVICAIVLAVLAAIAGVLVLTHEYQPDDSPDMVHQTATQDSQSSEEADSGVATVAGEGIPNGADLPAKITRQLLPDGQVVDPGPATDVVRPGEGSSQANASLPSVDNSARAVFYEAPTETLAASANEGRVEWRLRRLPTTAPAAGVSSNQEADQDLAIVGDVNIPTLGLTLRLTLRHNDDETMPADYLTEIIFAVPDDFEGEAIDDIGPLMFKASEQSTGQDLAGVTTAKVQDNLFLMAVRAPQPILDRNLALMRQLPWLKLNVLYKNGRVGEFSIAKGEGGNRLFQQVIDEWSRRSQAGSGLPIGMTRQPVAADFTVAPSQDEPVEAVVTDGDSAATPLATDDQSGL